MFLHEKRKRDREEVNFLKQQEEEEEERDEELCFFSKRIRGGKERKGGKRWACE